MKKLQLLALSMLLSTPFAITYASQENDSDNTSSLTSSESLEQRMDRSFGILDSTQKELDEDLKQVEQAVESFKKRGAWFINFDGPLTDKERNTIVSRNLENEEALKLLGLQQQLQHMQIELVDQESSLVKIFKEMYGPDRVHDYFRKRAILQKK